MSIISKFITKIRCLFGNHNISREKIAEVKSSNFPISAQCVTCKKELVLTRHSIATSSYYVDEV
jgi:hypothetical protein